MTALVRRQRRALLTALLTAGLVAGGVQAVAMPAASATPAAKPPRVQAEHPAKTRKVPVAARARDHTAAASAPRLAPPTWPSGTADTALTKSGKPVAGRVRAGDLPVWLAVPAARERAATQPPAEPPATARVRVWDRGSTARLGVRGLVVAVRRTDGGRSAAPLTLTVDTRAFRDAYGGDWAQRLRFVKLPACAATNPDRSSCRRGEPLPTPLDRAGSRLATDVSAGPADTLYALDDAPSGGTGDYTATTLSEAGSWAVSTQSGDFTWSYPMRTPPVPGGLQPYLTASYDSAAVDGHVTSTNNQPSWLGEGWQLDPGFVERRYKSCADDFPNATDKPADLCWGSDNATLSLGGHTTELIKDASGAWHPRVDDGSRVEHLVPGTGAGAASGEYWRITTIDGTQYYFGHDAATSSAWTVPVFGDQAGQPCHASTFAASSCPQVWRWNLDHVVNRQGDTITYFYTTESNSYGRDLGNATASYIRGGTLTRAEYGSRDGQGGQAPAKVDFAVADRCRAGSDCTQHTAANWPDVPWDLNCTANCTTQVAPTFWSTKRLASVTTSVLRGSSYQPVDTWTFDQTYPDPGDTGLGSTAALWLHGITHAGGTGGAAVSLPEITFDGVALPNRMNTSVDGLPPMDKFRVSGITTESGGVTSPHYANPDCTAGTPPAPDTNTTRCFPATWSPPQAGIVTDWFARYVVSTVTDQDRTGGSATEVTSYDYGPDAAWAYNDDPLVPAARRTWSQWRGYATVVVRHGDPNDTGRPQSATEYHYFRGLGKAKVTDSQGSFDDVPQLAGFLRETAVRNGPGGSVISDSYDDPWQHGPTANDGVHQAWLVRTGRSVTVTPLSTGGTRTTEVDTSYDDQGDPVRVDDHGDTADPHDDTCTTTTYARNSSTWVLTLPSDVATVGVSCATTPSFPGDAISHTRTYYDGGALGAAPGAGDATRTDEVSGYASGEPTWVTTNTSSYDGYGRALTSTDALNHTTTTSYSPATGVPATVTVTNPLGFATTTTDDPSWGLATRVVDTNGRQTDLTYDALDRLTAVWLPGRSKVAGDQPSKRFGYGVQANAASWTSDQELGADGGYHTSYQLYDGFLRPRQTQKPAAGGGRILTDTLYDSRGLAATTNDRYHDTADPGTTLVTAASNQISQQTVTTYDAAERPVTSTVRSLDRELWHTTTAYPGGDRTDVTPPAGGTPTTAVVDAHGHVIERRLYHGTTPTGTYDATRYAYTPAGELASILDAAGNRWSYGYDVRGRQVSVDDPDKGRSTMTYDDLGQQVTTTDARNQTVATAYDALGRKTAERQGSTTGPLLATWSYDTLSKGDPDSSTSYAGGNAYTTAVTGYDTAGRPTGTTVTIPAAGPAAGLAGDYTTSQTYKVDGSPATTTLPALGDLGAETVTDGYDSDGDVTTVSGAGHYVTDTAYTPYHEVSRVQFGDTGSRLWQSLYYDEATRRPTEARAQRELASGAAGCAPAQQADCTAVDDVRYHWDPAGNLTGADDTVAGSATDTQCFRYDPLRELTDAWTAGGTCNPTPNPGTGGPAPYWTSYGYDTTGDRTTSTRHGLGGAADTTSAYAYPDPGQAQPHTLRSVTSTGPDGKQHLDSYGYDTAGNTTARPGPGGAAQQLGWDAQERLASVTTAGSTTGYVYNADGTLLVAADPSGTTLYLPGGELRLNATSGARTGTRYYTEGGGTVAVRTAAGVRYLLNDRNGTATVSVTAGTLAFTKRWLDPFGNPRGTAPTGWPDDRGFVGGIQDGTGLTRLGARDYDPTTGRFVSVDRLLNPDDPQHLNPYAYAENNPTTNSDPTGLITHCPDGDCHAHPTPPSAWNPAPYRPPPPAHHPVPPRTLNNEHAAQSIWQYRAAHPWTPPRNPRMPSRLFNDEQNARQLWQYRAQHPSQPAKAPQDHTCGRFGTSPCPNVGNNGQWLDDTAAFVWKYRGPFEVALGLLSFIPNGWGAAAGGAGTLLGIGDTVSTCIGSVRSVGCGLGIMGSMAGAEGFAFSQVGKAAIAASANSGRFWGTIQRGFGNAMGGAAIGMGTISTTFSAITGSIGSALGDLNRALAPSGPPPGYNPYASGYHLGG
ncbi:MAG: RHS repeat-associated core domain-containing protein [Mycobacteriales bacterium]